MPLILSAADQYFFRSLWQFLLSAERTGLFEICSWRIYDLGLRQLQVERLDRRFPWCELIKFDFGQYPEHVALSAHSYAWKPIIIADNLLTVVDPVFWFDSATILHTKLGQPLSIVLKNGIWTLKSQTPLFQKCDPRVLDALEVPAVVRHLPERAAGALGFDPGHSSARQLVVDWKRHALVKEHIVPQDAAKYHKQDQAAFNCLLFKAVAESALALTDDEIDISSAWPAKDVTTRNIVAPTIPLWADPVVRAYFTFSKAIDRLSHRWQRFSGSRLGGAHRWWREHFTVFIRDLESGATEIIPSPPFSYYADPFLWRRDGKTWLFVEEFEYAKGRGRLVVMELKDSLGPLAPRPLTSVQDYGAFDCHASYPYLFDMGGEIYLIPETCERRSVDLYVCDLWPTKWRLVRRLLSDVDAVDTMVLWHNDHWWLFTSVRNGPGNRHLEIFFTENLLDGALHSHPVNEAGLYQDRGHGTGRNAGFLTKSLDGTIVRLLQESKHHYGEGVSAAKVELLDTERFEERVIDSIRELPIVGPGFSSHHVCRQDNLIAYDVRDRAR